MGAEVSNQSNSFLPLGKVRMGYPSGKLGGCCYSIRIEPTLGLSWFFVLNQQPRLLAKDRECPKHSRIHENPKINPMNTRLRKNQ